MFAQEPGTRDEQRLHHNAEAQVTDIDLSLEHEAFVCTVRGNGGTSALALLADDGRWEEARAVYRRRARWVWRKIRVTPALRAARWGRSK